MQMSGLGVALGTCTANTLKREARGAEKGSNGSEGWMRKRQSKTVKDT